MIIVESKRKKPATILKKYPDAILADVTSGAKDGLVKLSPFYPHGGIPVPFSEGYTATCVEAIWQGLKVFEGADVTASFASVQLDLHNAIINEDVMLNVDCKFAGLIIFAPSDLLVKVTANATFGGVDDKRQVIVSDRTHTLYISGQCVFSGIEIR